MQRYELENSNIKKTHIPILESSLPKVSIARNPFESISSMITMEAEFFRERNILNICKKNINNYITFYKYLLEDFDGIIFSYDALLSVPNTVMLCIENEIGVTSKNNNPLISSSTLNHYGNDYASSSKNLQLIKLSREILEKEDLSECFRLYKEVLNKVII
jgi:hypothetical protein